MKRALNLVLAVLLTLVCVVLGYVVWPIVMGFFVARLVWRAYRTHFPKRTSRSVALTYQR